MRLHNNIRAASANIYEYSHVMRASSGLAALEFAILAPIFLLFLTILFDLGSFIYNRTEIVAAVSAGAQFAVLAAQSGTSIATVVTETATVVLNESQNQLTSSGIAVTINGGSPSNDRCCITTSGSTVTFSCSASTTSCSDGSNPGLYLQIVGTSTFHPHFPLDTELVGSTMKSSVIERIQ